MAGQIHALVVGIDVYPDPRDRLSGCTNDARAIAAFLESRIAHPQLSLKVLLNQDATRQALIDGFRTHLGQATAGDTVLFFFAGHGSQERAPEIFWRIEPDHLDETLVCHDSRTPGSWDLADKELALLIHEVAARQPHVVVVLDCCHSGSGTRAAQWNDVVRRCQTDVRERPAEAFLAGVLGTSAGGRTRGDSGWDTPAAGRHVLLAACRDDQEAKEYFTPTERRGAFSWFLLETLQNGRSTLTYREAHARAKASLEVKVASQTPQLEATHDEDLDRPFLGGAIVSQSGIYTARHQPDSGWRLNAGRLNGISAARGAERTDLALFDDGADIASVCAARDAIAWAHVTNVSATESALAIDKGTLAPDSAYRAIIASLPLPATTVRFTGDAAGVLALQRALQTVAPGNRPSPYLAAVDRGEDLLVEAIDGGLQLTRRSDGHPLTQRMDGIDESSARTAIARLEHIARWTRVCSLENPGTRLNPADIALELYAGANASPLAGSEIELLYQRDSEGRSVSPAFRVKLGNRSELVLYCGLVGLSEMYGISNLFPQGTLRLEPGQEAWVNGGGLIRARIPETLATEGVTEYIDILKLIVTTSDFDVRLLAQPNIDKPYTRQVTRSLDTRRGTLNRMLERVHTRDLSAAAEDDEEIDDFLTTAVAIRTIRQPDGVPVTGVAAAQLNHGVAIEPHPDFRAVARLTSLNSIGREIGANAEPPLFRDRSGIAFPLQLTPARGGDPGLSGLELIDVVNAEAITPDAPLRLRVPIALAEHEVVLPLAHDGEFFLPVGRAIPTYAGTLIEIVRLPTAVAGRRSLASAVRIAFHKLVLQPLGVAYPYPRLSCVDLEPDGSVSYDIDPESVRRRVAAASRVVLFVHGIIGDTRMMAASIAARQLGELVMAFDYENLHTSIEENAALLCDRLSAAGLTAGHGKDFQIVAHSMGGLVGRWFIERLGGNAVVTHLVMAGTPNNGSPWPTMQDWAGTVAALALNSLTAVPWPVQAIGWILKGIERIDNALDEMSPGSPFLAALAASPDPHVPYTIIAGNTSLVASALRGGEDAPLSRILRKMAPRGLLRDALTAALFSEANDLAVAVASIGRVEGTRQPAPLVQETACDHVTYFSADVALRAVRTALNWAPASLETAGQI